MGLYSLLYILKNFKFQILDNFSHVRHNMASKSAKVKLGCQLDIEAF